ncbi:MAG: flagellar hook-basal body complex protein, partial [Selenomonadaceae bacterium]|nr:flagellar hook-basal body complex protein [Selenomonadaceae bacterium]
MMRSLFSGVSGLKAHQTRMDVIGNNIANVNTTGFKSGRATFADTISQTLTDAAAPQDDIGGTNPKQVGLGTGVASIDTIFTDGTVQSTGKNTDLALSGNGLFVVKQGNQTYYTRDGAFAFDSQGNYVLPSSGLYVQGWMAKDGVLSTAGTAGNIQIAAGKSMGVKQTASASYTNNLNADMAGYEISSINVNYADGTSKTGLSNFEATSSSKGSITLHTDKGTAIPLDKTAAYPFTTGDALVGKTLWTSKIDSVQAEGGGATLTLGTGDAVFSINGKQELTCKDPLTDGDAYSVGGTYTITGTIDATGVKTDSPDTGKTTLKVTLNDAANKNTKITITVPQPENFNYKDGDAVSFSLPITSIKAATGAKLNTANGQQVSLEKDLDITSADQTYEYKGTAADGNVASIERVGQGTAYSYNGKEISSVSIVTKDGKILDGLSGAKYQ